VYGFEAIEREDKRLHRWKSQTAIELIAARRVENKISSDKTGAAMDGTCDSSMQIGYDWANLRSHMLIVRWSQLQRQQRERGRRVFMHSAWIS
jgi:hypothetical protein